MHAEAKSPKKPWECFGEKKRVRKPCWRRGARANGLEMGEFARALLLQQELFHPLDTKMKLI